MKETLALSLGFMALIFGARLLYQGYTRLLAWLEPRRLREEADPAPLLLTCFSMLTLFILLIMAFIVLIVDLPLTVGSVVLSGVLIVALENLFIYLGCRISRRLTLRRMSGQLLRQKRRTEENYYQMLEEQYNRQRVLIHDIRKHLGALRDLAGTTGNSAVARYVQELENSPALRNRVRICGHPVLDVILCRYQELCQKKGVRFAADVRDGSVDFLSHSDLTALFANLLENAVEAAEGGAEASLELFVGSRPGSALMVSLVNTCAAPPVSDGQGGWRSAKPDPERHGLGMKSVGAVVKGYGGELRQYYDQEAGLFHTVILLK